MRGPYSDGGKSGFARAPYVPAVHDMLVHGAGKKIDKKLRGEFNRTAIL
jgi:hypothetical protein